MTTHRLHDQGPSGPPVLGGPRERMKNGLLVLVGAAILTVSARQRPRVESNEIEAIVDACSVAFGEGAHGDAAGRGALWPAGVLGRAEQARLPSQLPADGSEVSRCHAVFSCAEARIQTGVYAGPFGKQRTDQKRYCWILLFRSAGDARVDRAL